MKIYNIIRCHSTRRNRYSFLLDQIHLIRPELMKALHSCCCDDVSSLRQTFLIYFSVLFFNFGRKERTTTMKHIIIDLL